jgi:hypothetical protein
MPERSAGERNVVVEILDSWPRIGKLVLCACIIVVLAGGLAYFIIQLLNRSHASELQIGSAHVLFQQQTKDGNKFVLLVFPQGWNQTEIPIHEGDKLSVKASGRVHIDLTGLMERLIKRRELEERYRKDPKEIFLEDHFTDEDRKMITPRWHWSSPDGVKEAEMNAQPTRRARSIVPKVPYGTLLGAVSDSNVEPEDHPDVAEALTAAAFPIGRKINDLNVQPSHGYLYLAVNDVVYKPIPDLFFLDNIGAYLVQVEVTQK